MNRDQALAQSLAACFEKHMLAEYLPRIRHCLALLDEEQAWRKPSRHGNAIANLLIHLTGNTTQWILCGPGGQRDDRDRDREFAARLDDESRSLAEILDRLELAVTKAVSIVKALSPEELLAPWDFQGGRYRGDGLSGVLHVLEHFSGHTGRIYTQTKLLTGADLGFYSHLSANSDSSSD